VRIGTDMAALGTHRVLARSDGAASRSLQRLSTGVRINSAADDAGGLTVSEGLRSRSAGLRQAVRNSRDGIDVVRTADAALAGTTSVLQRMRDLAVQAANDGALDASAKDTLQREMDQLSRELTRIATTTTYAGIPLLDGSYRGIFQVGAEVGETIAVAIGGLGNGMDAAGLGVDAIDVTQAAAVGALAGFGGGSLMSTVRITPAVSDQEGTRTAATIGLAGDFTSPGRFEASYTGLSGTLTYDGRTLDLAAVSYAGDVTASDYRRTLNNAVRAAFGLGGNPVSASSSELLITGERPGNGSTIADAQQLTPTFTASSLPPTTPPTPPTSPGSPSTPVVVAHDPVSTIDRAIQRISTTRAGLGAVENRLEHTVARLAVASENATAAYSRIRDADTAMEMTDLTRNQVLVQAGSALLAQANQRPQGVLRLLT
jgi:flagellin